MNRAKAWPVIVALLLAVPIVGAQANDQNLHATFTADRTEANMTEAVSIVEAHGGSSSIAESFPEQLFASGMNATGCAGARAQLAMKPYFSSIGTCQGPSPPDEPTETQTKTQTNQHLAFRHLGSTNTFEEYAVDGTQIFDRLRYESSPSEKDERRSGRYLIYEYDDDVLSLHDSARGLVTFRPGDDGVGSIFLEFPSDAAIDRTTNGALLGIGGEDVVLSAPDATWPSSHVLRSSGFVSLHVAAEDEPLPSTEPQLPKEELEQAIADGHLAAEVRLDDNGVEVLAYADIDIELKGSLADVPTEAFPLRIEADADLDHGTTILVTVPLDHLPGDGFLVRYYDVFSGGQTQVIIEQADSLQDILTVSPGEGQPEYWFVKDANGVHMFLYFPHWSVHAVEVSSIFTTIVQPSIVAGIILGVVGIAGLSTAMFWPRRRA